MGYYVSNIIGIRTGGVFSDAVDADDMKRRIIKVIKDMDNVCNPTVGVFDYCLSKELIGNKGSYIIIAGVFNYWTFKLSSQFSKELSKEFGTEVLHICWDEERGTVQFGLYLDGEELSDVSENPIHQIMRRII